MAAITAALVKQLREKTGAGMMDCKNALKETDGDVESANDWLRKKGLAAAAKKAGVTLSGMKSRVQRGRKQLLDVFEQCCAIEVDARGRPIEMSTRAGCGCGPQE